MKKSLSISCAATLAALALVDSVGRSITVAATEDLNIYGEPLQLCSSEGMALTGFTRKGLCEDYEDPEIDEADYASHNVCIDIPSSRGGIFCTVTGQPNWCDEESPCQEDRTKDCPVENWCVCEWAFARYLNLAEGCDKIADIVCDSTNIKVIMHYQAGIEQHNDPHSIKALACIRERCGKSVIHF